MEAHAIACGLSPDFVRRIQDARIEIEDLPLNLQEVYGLFSDLPFRDRRMLQECLCQPPKRVDKREKSRHRKQIESWRESEPSLPLMEGKDQSAQKVFFQNTKTIMCLSKIWPTW
uniref:uncharacterized protein LOC120344647 n=1 Tax=Styela clava TaxID=7725 RepID=UPI001939C529|nr:uncharacterized protein LOC120344647 [Styela clava]